MAARKVLRHMVLFPVVIGLGQLARDRQKTVSYRTEGTAAVALVEVCIEEHHGWVVSLASCHVGSTFKYECVESYTCGYCQTWLALLAGQCLGHQLQPMPG